MQLTLYAALYCYPVAVIRRSFSIEPPSDCPTGIVPLGNEGYRTEQFPASI